MLCTDSLCVHYIWNPFAVAAAAPRWQSLGLWGWPGPIARAPAEPVPIDKRLLKSATATIPEANCPSRLAKCVSSLLMSWKTFRHPCKVPSPPFQRKGSHLPADESSRVIVRETHVGEAQRPDIVQLANGEGRTIGWRILKCRTTEGPWLDARLWCEERLSS